MLRKKIDLNNIFTDYSVAEMTNSYILSYYSNMYTKKYDKAINSTININSLSTVNIDEETHIKYKTKETNKFNSKTTYNYNENIQTNSLIISNVGNELTSYDGSYIIYYSTEDGLRQLSYHFKEGNGIYYDKDNHLIELNIDNNTIKEMNRKLYFDINSIPISSLDNYGISYIDNEYLTVNNGILSIKQELIENVISYKYKIKNIYNSLKVIESSFAYYDSVYNKKEDTTNWFKSFFNNIIKNDDDSMISRNISYEINNSLYFPNSSLKYIDNYYFSNGLISYHYAQFIDLNESNSYIIYCKDIEKIALYSYLENQYYYYSTEFNNNLLNNIEMNINNAQSKSIEIVESSELYSYIYMNDKNEYNKILFDVNTVNYDTNLQNNQIYSCICNNIRYKSKLNDEKIFKKNGIILNSKINKKQIEKCKISYYLINNTVNYDLNLQKINIKYDQKNIKILYDDRDIKYCSYTIDPIINDDNSKYYFFVNDDDFEDLGAEFSTLGYPIPESISLAIKNSNVSFQNSMSYLFYGYNFVYNQSISKYNKKYYGLWEDLPTSYITSNFIKNINNGNIILFNFNELYTENFDEVEYNPIITNSNIIPNMENTHKLILCELFEKTVNNKTNQYIKISKYNNINIQLYI